MRYFALVSIASAGALSGSAHATHDGAVTAARHALSNPDAAPGDWASILDGEAGGVSVRAYGVNDVGIVQRIPKPWGKEE